MKRTSAGRKLKKLLQRPGKVLAVLGAPNAFHAKILDASGVEACFVGTSITGGNYTGLPDLGVLSMTECVGFAKWIARAVKMPVILDGDTGHGGIMAVRRLVQECIDAGLAGLRLDDQPLEQKRRTMSRGISLVAREEAVTRYRAAVEAKNEIDPDFIIMAQCYARNAVNGGMAELLKRLRLYEKDGGVDWVQFEAPRSVEEIRRARAVVKGSFSAMKGQLPRALTLAEHKALGLNAAWYTFLPDQVLKIAAWSFLQDFKKKDVGAWDDFVEAHAGTPFTGGAKLPWDATGMTELAKFEARCAPRAERRSRK
jgi:2-methylisocitrate lyase-like PEP mutase family enzyme